MGRIFDGIDPALADWLHAQPVFFISTAPNHPQGHVNVSPKGGAGLFRVLDPHRIAYLDLIGSGAETIAHLRENGRIVAMFCAFSGPPKVIRLHGRGSAHEPGSSRYDEILAELQPPDELLTIARSAIEIEVNRIADSCGFVVPKMTLEGQRDQLVRWGENQAQRNGDDWKARYVQANNLESIDGLPALSPEPGVDAESVAAFSSSGRAL